jgi:diguanylate cyclase (GGDEF)-like protein/PAS domain S-box-containing protein
MKLVGRRKTKEWRDIVLATILSITFPLFTASIHLSERLYRYFSDLAPLVTEYVVNFIFLYLAGLLYITYHRWKRAEKKQQEMEDIISSISPDTLIVVDREKNIIMCNPSIQKMFGYEPDEVIDKKTDLLYSHEQSETEELQETEEIPEHEGYRIGFAQGERKDGGKIPLEIITGNLSAKDGAVLLLRDITDRREAEAALQKSEQKFRALFEDSRDAIYITTKEGRFIDFNQAYLDLFGYSKEEMVPLYAKDTYANLADRDMFRKTIEEKGSVRDYEIKLRKKTGQEMECLITATIRYGNDGGISGYQGIIKDITEQKKMEEELRTLSVMDDLTGLYNRRGFFTLSQQQMKMAERAKKDMLLFFADLDNMKEINDRLGHQEGDKALVEIATVLKEVFRESDIIGRMGGDEFAALAIDTTDETEEVLTARLQNYLDTHNKLETRNYALSLSIGIAHYDHGNPSSLDELMSRADTLMYEEKRKKIRIGSE